LVFSVQSRHGSHAPLHPGDCLAGNCFHVDPVDAILQRSFEFFQGDVRDGPRRFPALIIGLDCFADDFDDGFRVDGDRADGVFDEQPFFDDQHAFVPVVLGGFLHVGEVGLRRQPADALGVEQAGLDLGENLVGLPAFAGGPAGRYRRIDRLRLDAARLAVLDELSSEGPADRRAGVVVIDRDDGIHGELAVVHALDEDDVIVAVGHLCAVPQVVLAKT
jgi:hypothetical protein